VELAEDGSAGDGVLLGVLVGSGGKTDEDALKVKGGGMYVDCDMVS
jgi:hypothetical protein